MISGQYNCENDHLSVKFGPQISKNDVLSPDLQVSGLETL